MRILYTARTSADSLLLGLDGFYDGRALEIVLAMKRTSVFGERGSVDQYLTFHRNRFRHLYGVEISLTGDTPEALATSFLDALITHGVVVRWRDDTPKEHDHE